MTKRKFVAILVLDGLAVVVLAAASSFWSATTVLFSVGAACVTLLTVVPIFAARQS